VVLSVWFVRVGVGGKVGLGPSLLVMVSSCRCQGRGGIEYIGYILKQLSGSSYQSIINWVYRLAPSVPHLAPPPRGYITLQK
jgi:hypothetical protein